MVGNGTEVGQALASSGMKALTPGPWLTVAEIQFPVYVRKTIPGIWLFLGNFTAFISKQIKAVIAGEMILIGP